MQSIPDIEGIKKDIHRIFKSLETELSKYDPIELVNILQGLNLVKTRNNFWEQDEVAVNDLGNEYIIRLLLTKPYQKGRSVSKKVAIRLNSLANVLIKNIDLYDMFSEYEEYKGKEESIIKEHLILKDLAHFTSTIRNSTYTLRFSKFIESFYKPHDAWLKDKLGFETSDILNFYECFCDLLNEKIAKLRKILNKYSNSLVIIMNIKNKHLRYFLATLFDTIVFPQLKSVLKGLFKVDKNFFLKKDFSKSNLENLLNRLSQSFGYVNSNFEHPFKEIEKSTLSYNTLNERPLVKIDNEYYMTRIRIFSSIIFDTLQYDLLSDKEYKIEYDKIKGEWLEKEVAKIFTKLFGKENVLMNPMQDSNKTEQEICDVLCGYSEKLFIIQCKTKNLRYETKQGKDVHLLKDDLEKSLLKNMKQCQSANEYLTSSQYPKFIIDGKPHQIADIYTFSEIFNISVTLYDYANLLTKATNMNNVLLDLNGKLLPWSVSLFALDIVTDILDNPFVFIHYLQRRKAFELLKPDIHADEIDLLGSYLENGLYLYDYLEKEPNSIFMNCLCEKIDEYYVLFKDKPKLNIPESLLSLIDTIAKLSIAYKSDIICCLLDSFFANNFNPATHFDTVVSMSRDDGKNHSLSIKVNDSILICIFSKIVDDERSNEQFINDYLYLKHQQLKTKYNIALIKNVETEEVIDNAFIIIADWIEDKEALEFANKTFGKSDSLLERN